MSYEALGETILVRRFAGRVLLHSVLGDFDLAPDLSVTLLDGPGWNEVTTSAALGGALFVEGLGKSVFFTSDGLTFQTVENRAGSRLAALGADVPRREAMLAATDEGAAPVTACP